LIVSGDHEREGLVVFEGGAAIEADTRDTGNIEFHYQYISLLSGWEVSRCTVDARQGAGPDRQHVGRLRSARHCATADKQSHANAR
jgi:hypothetical protein